MINCTHSCIHTRRKIARVRSPEDLNKTLIRKIERFFELLKESAQWEGGEEEEEEEERLESIRQERKQSIISR